MTTLIRLCLPLHLNVEVQLSVMVIQYEINRSIKVCTQFFFTFLNLSLYKTICNFQAASSRDIEGSSKSGSDVALTSFEPPTFVMKLDEPFINSVDLGLRFPPGSVLSMIQMNTAPPYTYKLVSNIVPPLTYGKYFSNNPILDNICIN
uniref:UEV domain-containing protein n=1 Tax=Heterorhabditis bacteriophora TaxID=37862 RepID=A0A1I7X9K6_HETBA